MVDLDNNVDDVKKQIRNADDLDYEALLEEEKDGENRKTVVEFLEKKIGEEVEEEIESDEDTKENVEENLVEEIEEETSGGVLSSFTDPQILAGGAILGLILGLVVGAVALPMETQTQITDVQAEERVSTLINAGGQLSEDSVDVSVEKSNSMFYINATATQTVNGTAQTQSQTYYMSSDGTLLFPEVVRSPLGNQRVAIDVDQAIQRAQQPSQPGINESVNTTQ